MPSARSLLFRRGKGGKTLLVALHSDARAALAEHLLRGRPALVRAVDPEADPGYLFPSERDHRLPLGMNALSLMLTRRHHASVDSGPVDGVTVEACDPCFWVAPDPVRVQRTLASPTALAPEGKPRLTSLRRVARRPRVSGLSLVLWSLPGNTHCRAGRAPFVTRQGFEAGRPSRRHGDLLSGLDPSSCHRRTGDDASSSPPPDRVRPWPDARPGR
jgi:hypothetical protein